MTSRSPEQIYTEATSLDVDFPRSNAKLLRDIEVLSEDLKGLVADYRDIRREDYESGEDGADDFWGDREGLWSDIIDYLSDLTDEDETEEETTNYASAETNYAFDES